MSVESLQTCERCGAPASVTVTAAPSNRTGPQPRSPSEHRYCRACATAIGVPIPPRGARTMPRPEPGQVAWSDIEQYLASYEAILHDDPSFRDRVRSLARQLRRLAGQLPGPVPPAVAAAFERLDEAGADEE